MLFAIYADIFNIAVLKDGVQSYACLCVAGFSGSRCETNINECSPNPCQNGGNCTVSTTYNLCALRLRMYISDELPSWYIILLPTIEKGLLFLVLNWLFCFMLCKQDQVNGFQCTCPSGYFGDRCQSERDECAPQPCMNGGTCHVSIHQYCIDQHLQIISV